MSKMKITYWEGFKHVVLATVRVKGLYIDGNPDNKAREWDIVAALNPDQDHVSVWAVHHDGGASARLLRTNWSPTRGLVPLNWCYDNNPDCAEAEQGFQAALASAAMTVALKAAVFV